MKTIIIGGVALGASCGARLKRLRPLDEVIIIEKGKYPSFANCGLPYYLSGEINKKENLIVTNVETLKNKYGIDVKILTEVINIFPNDNKIEIKDLTNNKTSFMNYDNLVLAMGGKEITLGFENRNNVYFLRTVDDAIKLKNRLLNISSITVIGGGFIGLEAIDNILKLGIKINLVEAKDHVSNLDKDMANILKKLLIKKGVNLYLNEKLEDIINIDDDKVLVKTNKSKIISQAVLLSIGVRPNIDLAKSAGIKIDNLNAIKVNKYLQTNFKNIYAGGDLIANTCAINNKKMYVPLAGYANKHGRIIANNIANLKYFNKKITLASVFQFDNYTFASVGFSEELAKKYDIKYHCIYQNANSHATYYPGATSIYSKILFDDNGKILGGQMVGLNMVEKHIDVLSNVILNNGTYHDLMEIESTYSPIYGSAKSVLNFSGFMIDNILNLPLKTISPIEIKKIENDVFIIDVRDPISYQKGHIGHAINIPLDQLEKNIHLLDKTKTIYIHCQVGITSYNACCKLKAYGFDVVNIMGGYSLYKLINDD